MQTRTVVKLIEEMQTRTVVKLIIVWIIVGMGWGMVIQKMVHSCPDCPEAVVDTAEGVPENEILIRGQIKHRWNHEYRIGYWIHTDTISYWITGIEQRHDITVVDTTDLDTTCFVREDCGKE